MEDKRITEKESLQIITEMIGKVKYNFHNSGTSAILWGSVIAVCGLVSFAELYWNFYIGFEIWLLTLIALIPQVIISIRENRRRKVVSHDEFALDAVWIVYGISVFALSFYANVVPGVTQKMMAAKGIHITGLNEHILHPSYDIFLPSYGSLLLMLYAIPTLVTGIIRRFPVMVWGAVLCYIFFMISCFVPTAFDMLLNGLAGIFNWLIPGLILRRRYYKQKIGVNV
jgi:hypothetical protein